MGDVQKAILTRLGDGAQHNLFAFPFVEEHDDFKVQVLLVMAAGMLAAQGFIETSEPNGETLWMTITDAGRRRAKDLEAPAF